MAKIHGQIPSQPAGADTARRDRTKIGGLMQQLERALAAASFNRTAAWRTNVESGLRELHLALQDACAQIQSRRGLYGEILQEHPRLASRIQRLIQQYEDLQRCSGALWAELQRPNESFDVRENRKKLHDMLQSLREVQANETELIFEAIGRDIGGGD